MRRSGPSWALAGLAACFALPAAAADLDGLWKSEWDGLAMSVTGRTATVYEATETRVIPINTLAIDAEDRYTTSDGRVFQLSLVDGKLQFINQRGNVFLSFLAVESLPPEQPQTANPTANFDRFWEAFAENFALFDLGEVDWAAERDVWRGTAGQADSDTLFDIFSTMLAPLNDVHTTVTRSDTLETWRSGPERDPFWDGRENTFLNNIANEYLRVPLQTRFIDPRLRFGILPGNVGYLSVSSFLDASSRQPLADTLDAVLAELEDTDGLVVDLRFNPGGTDDNLLALLERLLSPTNTTSHVRQVRLTTPLPEVYSEPFLLAMAPRDNPFHRRPVVVLTSANTASAAEAGLLSMMREPRFVQVGEATRGVFSKLLFRHLPNGWLVTLSNERYASLSGEDYEQRGVPPGVVVDKADYDLDAGIDGAIGAALALVATAVPTVWDPVHPGAAANGLWFDPARVGEGWHIQRLSDRQVFVRFYTFAPGGGADWVVGLGAIEDNELRLPRLVTARGGRFGAPADDPEPIEQRDWGHGVIRFSDCGSAVADIAGPDSHRGFAFRLERLAAIPGLGCDPEAKETLVESRLTGTWFVPERPGEGWLVSHIGPDRAVVSWYTFDTEGRRQWLIGPGTIDDEGLLVVDVLQAGHGAAWGHVFDPAEVTTPDAGRLEFRVTDCDAGEVRFTPEAGGETLAFEVSRLAAVEGVDYPPGCG